jgi:hypothetical protein
MTVMLTGQGKHASTQSSLPGAINIPNRLVSTAPGHMQSRARGMHDVHNRNYTTLAHSGFLTQRGSNNIFALTPPSSGLPRGSGSPRRSSQHMLRNEILKRGASAFEVACFSCTCLCVLMLLSFRCPFFARKPHVSEADWRVYWLSCEGEKVFFIREPIQLTSVRVPCLRLSCGAHQCGAAEFVELVVHELVQDYLAYVGCRRIHAAEGDAVCLHRSALPCAVS